MPLVDIYPEPFTPPSAVYRWPFIIDIIPSDMLSARRTNWLARVKVDGVEKQITQAVVDENESNVGQELTIDLAKVSDRSAFTSDSVTDFGIGKQIAGAWDEATFLTLLDDATTQNKNYTIAGQGAHTANDRASVVLSSAENDKLNKTSEEGLILYDPNRTSISDTDINPVQGFTTELVPIAGMKLENVLQELLVDRCGFTDYYTDLPEYDYPIQRIDVPMGTRFWDALGPHIGMFYPATRIISDVIHITDTTIEQPADYPAPYEVTLAVAKDQLNLTQEVQKLDGLFVHVKSIENNYDFTDFDFQYPSEVNDTSETAFSRIFVRFWKIVDRILGRIQLVRTELNIEDSVTTRDSVTTETSSTVNQFGPDGLIHFTRSRGHLLMPDLPDATESLRDTFEDRTQFSFQVHPFRRNQKYISRRETRSAGLITLDADNPNIFGDPARQEARIADRSNNFVEGQTYEYGRTQTRVEKAEPLKDGTVRVTTNITDEVRGRKTVLDPQIRAGEIGIAGSASTSEIIPVFAEENTTRSTQRMDDLNINELPLKYGYPLARRILINRQTVNQNVTLPVIGYDPYLQKGALIAPKDRAGASLGNYIITGRRITCTRQGLIMDLSARQVATQATVTIQSAPQSSQYGLLESTNQIFPRLLECDSTTYLSLDPATVADLSIEAKESTQGAYTNLEAGILDLSAFSGIRTIQVRVTAGAIAGTQPVRRTFDVITNAVTKSIEALTEEGETLFEESEPVYDYVT